MKVFIDTDLNFPSDDFQALMLLMAAENAKVVGCSAAAGNTWAEEVWANLHHVKSILNEPDLKIFGNETAARFARDKMAVHTAIASGSRNFTGAYGKSETPRPWITEDAPGRSSFSSPEAIVALARANPGEISLLCVGPLSNLSDALDIEPKLPQLLKSVTIMGGYFSREGRTDKIDFNFWFDPVAAQRVLGAKFNTRLVPLDVCQDGGLTGELLVSLSRHIRGRGAVFFDDFLGMARQHGMSMALSDQLAAILLLYPELVEEEETVSLAVDHTEDFSRGKSTVVSGSDGKVKVVRRVDVKGFHDRLVQLVRRMAKQYCTPFGFFETPAYRYIIGERLSKGPFTILASTFNETYAPAGITHVNSVDQFVEALSPLAGIFMRAKERGEPWPPAHRADAIIAEREASIETSFDHLTIKELEFIAISRLLNARAIATIGRPGSPPRGFTCLSEVTPARRDFLKSQFKQGPGTSDLIFECSYVERESCGLFALEYMATLLYVWAREQSHPRKRTNLFSICQDSHTTYKQKLLSIGYKRISDHTIADGFEKGRVLGMYSQSLDHRLIQRLREKYKVLGEV